MAQGKKRIYTVGTSNRSLEEFLEILRHWSMGQVVDVRRFPTSSRFPWFKGENLARVLAEKGLEYIPMGKELGGYRKGGYEAYTWTESFKRALDHLERLALQKPTVIICAEVLPWKCHRLFISRALEERGWRVIHLLNRKRTWTPSLQNPLLQLINKQKSQKEK